jgi:hypothetical protein
VFLLLVGVLLLGLAAYDAAVTTISTTSAGGPVTSRLSRWWWSVAHTLGRRPTSVLLTSAGPLLLTITVGAWLVLLWTGWTLVFSADPSAVVSSTAREPADWSQRAYFAGFTTFTLGVGDYVPVGAPWQLLTVIASASGLALTTAAITYLIPVVTAVTERSKQAAAICGLGADPQSIVVAAYHDGSVRFLEPVLLQMTDGLLVTAERHLAYPILHYFHPRSPVVELRVQLASLDDALTLVEHGLAGDVQRPHPAAIDGARAAIDQLLDRAHVSASHPALPLDLQPLRDAGLPVVDDGSFTEQLERLAERRGRLATFAAESKWERSPTS